MDEVYLLLIFILAAIPFIALFLILATFVMCITVMWDIYVREPKRKQQNTREFPWVK